MAISRIKYGGVRGKALNYSEFLCDGIEDLENLPTNIKKTDDFPTCAIGSRAFIGDITYMLFPSGEWKQSKLVVCDCGCIHGNGSESEEGDNAESTSEDLDAALSTIAAIIDGSITEIEDTKVTGTIGTALNSNSNLTSISFANATSVGEGAFYGCSKLTNVSLPSVTSIGSNTFFNCKMLTDVNIPNVTSIGNLAFNNCTSLININLPGATTIGAGAFSGCTNLTDLYLPGAEASYTNAPFGLNTETCTIHYEYDFSADEPEQQDNG